MKQVHDFYQLKKRFLYSTCFFLISIFLVCLLKKDVDKGLLLFQRILLLSVVYIGCIFSILIFSRYSPNKKLIEAIIENRYKLAMIFFILFVIIHVHGFSIDVWEQYVPSDTQQATLLFGRSQGITSDVYGVILPMDFSQVLNHYPTINYQIANVGVNTAYFRMPSFDIVNVFNPQLWGFYMGNNIGISWYYWFTIFSTLLTSFEFMCFLSHNKRKLAFLGAIILTCSPVMLWWSGQGVVYAFIYMQWFLVCIIKYLDNLQSRKRFLLLPLLMVGAIGFISVWYPALQVPLGFFTLFMLGYIFSRFEWFKALKRKDLLYIIVSILLILAVLSYILVASKDTIELISNTVHPGKRIELGGTYNRRGVFYYVFQPLMQFLFPATENPNTWASVPILMPIILFAFPCILVKKITEKKWYLALYTFFVLLIIWLFVPVPMFLAKLTLFSYITTVRAPWVISILCIYLFVIFIHVCSETSFIRTKINLVLNCFSIGVLIYFSLRYWDDIYASALGEYKAVCIYALVILIMIIFSFALLKGNKKLISIILISNAVYFAITINPLEMGTSALFDSSLSRTIRKIQEKDPNGYWIIDEGFPYSNYLMAQGVRSFGATNSFMDKSKWTIVDPMLKNEYYYNRYCQIAISFTEENTSFKLLSEDYIHVNLNVSSLHDLEIQYIVSKNNIEQYANDLQTEAIYKDSKSGFIIYQIVE